MERSMIEFHSIDQNDHTYQSGDTLVLKKNKGKDYSHQYIQSEDPMTHTLMCNAGHITHYITIQFWLISPSYTLLFKQRLVVASYEIREGAPWSLVPCVVF